MFILASSGAKSRNCLNNFMDYLTKYYKNLSEDLSRRVTLLENYLTEMQAQMAAGTPEMGVPGAQTQAIEAQAAVAPPSGSPSQNQGSPSGAPTDPGQAPRRRDGETDEDYAKRYEEWLKAKKRWEVYQKFREDIEKGGHKVFSYPQRIPGKKVTVDGESVHYAVPPAKAGDIYIGQNGQVYRVNDQGIWVLV
jgi:hypothetical protein